MILVAVDDLTERRLAQDAPSTGARSISASPRRWRPSAGWPGGIAHDFNNLLTAIIGI